ncbi:MAG: thiamine-phosphate kinase [Candidatus Syntrophoarchaeum sp. WYZ-LMO15]|nr:MAG: thiamine-phosphate kinase [Candidatus Syntrophoarchaeum sp. WYZ-LMO15]
MAPQPRSGSMQQNHLGGEGLLNGLLRDIGERRLIELVSSYFETQEEDCAVVELGGECLLLTSDMLHEKSDFPPQMTPYQMGWSLVAVNLSDIAAMGGEPLFMVDAIGVPPEFSVESFKELLSGIHSCALRFGLGVLGGDLDAHDEITLTGFVLGVAREGRVIRRSGAKVGDLLCITGYLGSAGGGLRLIEREKDVDLSDPLVKALFEPVPRVKEGLKLSGSGFVTSMTDISDGLSVSLADLSRASHVGFEIDWERIPVRSELFKVVEDADDLRSLLLSAGGDYELLFTVMPEGVNELRQVVDFTVIGRVVEKNAGERVVPSGYDHFKVEG